MFGGVGKIWLENNEMFGCRKQLDSLTWMILFYLHIWRTHQNWSQLLWLRVGFLLKEIVSSAECKWCKKIESKKIQSMREIFKISLWKCRCIIFQCNLFCNPPESKIKLSFKSFQVKWFYSTKGTEKETIF